MGVWAGTVPTILAGDVPNGDDWDQVLDELTAVSAAWTSWNPTWSSTGTAIALGNGTITGKYRQVGKWVTAQLVLTMGSTTTYGTGFYIFTVPVNPLAVGYLGSAKLLDAGTVDRNGTSYFYDGTHFTATSNAGSIGQLVPHTWAVNDTITIQIDYEAA